jgi:hypothetical protein
VKFKITPVSVLEGLQGEPVVIVDPDKEEAAEEATQYGCMACLAPLLDETLGTECKGEHD